MKLTKKQRRDIYLRAAELLQERWDNGYVRIYCCEAIEYLSNVRICESNYPEFFMMKPMTDEVSEFHQSNWGWFYNPINEENLNARICALLLAAEMCK